MRRELVSIFSVLKTGDQEELRFAKKRLDKLWHDNSKSFKKYAAIALKEMREFDSIQNTKNQEAFVSGLSLFFLVLSDAHFKELRI